MFRIDLRIAALIVAACALGLGAILGPVPLWVNGSDGVIFTSAFFTGGLFLGELGLATVALAALSVVRRLAHQACAVDGLRPAKSFRRGLQLLWRNLKDAGLMWLATLGIRLGWMVLMVPVVFALVAAGLGLGGLPLLAVSAVSATEPVVWSALAAGVFVFLVVLLVPLASAGGIRQAFESVLWTLTHGALRVESASERVPAAVSDPHSLASAQPAAGT